MTAKPQDRSRAWVLGWGWALVLLAASVWFALVAQLQELGTINGLRRAIAASTAAVVERDRPCTQGMTLQPGQSCTMRVPLFSRSGERT